MATETVTIGCKSPAGFYLEIGYKIDPTGRQIKGENYQRVVIRGWNHHSIDMRKQLLESKSTAGVPHGMNTRPFLNRNVPKAFWDQWVKEHAGSWLLKNEILFAVAANDHAGAAMRVKEGEATPKIFEPIDPKATIVPGIKKYDPEEA
jgi:hypothetical protein